MPNYTKYPNKMEMKSRLSRKGNRSKVFQLNKTAKKREKAGRAK